MTFKHCAEEEVSFVNSPVLHSVSLCFALNSSVVRFTKDAVPNELVFKTS